jgi:hypothetical protein
MLLEAGKFSGDVAGKLLHTTRLEHRGFAGKLGLVCAGLRGKALV